MYKMQRLEVSGAVRPIYGSLGVKTVNLDVRWSRFSTSRPGRFAPWEETLYSLYLGLGGPQGRCGKSRPHKGFDPRTVQPVASRSTDRPTNNL